jgi:hypothetical protein
VIHRSTGHFNLDLGFGYKVRWNVEKSAGVIL